MQGDGPGAVSRGGEYGKPANVGASRAGGPGQPSDRFAAARQLAGRLTIEPLLPFITLRFDRSGGPGGQNVNKVATRVTLLFDLQRCPLFTAEQRGRIATRLASRIARDGNIRVVAQSHRTQAGNRDAAETRLVELLGQAMHEPKRRKPTKPTAASRSRRVSAKQRQSRTKLSRRNPASLD